MLEIKVVLLQLGLIPQSIGSKQADLSKLIEGICGQEAGVELVYRLVRLVNAEDQLQCKKLKAVKEEWAANCKLKEEICEESVYCFRI